VSAQPENEPCFALDDLVEHLETYGVDVFPPIEVSMETTRSQAYFAELRDLWPHIYANMTLGGSDFKISTSFEFSGGKQAQVDTFVLNPRGPVFIFPRRIGLFGEDVDLQGAEPTEVFKRCLDLFLRTFVGRQILRVGMVRSVVLGTGQMNLVPWLGERVLTFGTAGLTGASCVLVYEDENSHNIRIQMQPVQLMKHTPIPAAGAVVSSPSQFGLQIALDVNNKELTPQDADARNAVLETANELWPGKVLQFLNGRRLP
jgi:hypothetical protein